jgi:hypothetical protein
MILGQSAALIAALSLDEETPIHALQYEEIKTKLEAAGQVLEHQEM